MITRKPKPTLSSLIELPAERLQLATVTIDQKTTARGGRTSEATDLPATRSLPSRRKVTLH
jgi:hypothetical protein